MKALAEKLGSSENRVWGTLALFDTFLIPAMIVLWKTMDREEKVRSMMLVVALAFICILSAIPFIGWICAVVVLVFYVITIINFYKGKLDYQIPLCYQIANKIVKQ